MGEEACSSPSPSSRLPGRGPRGDARSQKRPRCPAPALIIKCILAAARPAPGGSPQGSGQAKNPTKPPSPHPKAPSRAVLHLQSSPQPWSSFLWSLCLEQHLLLPWYPHPGKSPGPAARPPCWAGLNKPQKQGRRGAASPKPPQTVRWRWVTAPQLRHPLGTEQGWGWVPSPFSPRLAATCPGGSGAPSREGGCRNRREFHEGQREVSREPLGKTQMLGTGRARGARPASSPSWLRAPRVRAVQAGETQPCICHPPTRCGAVPKRAKRSEGESRGYC